MEFGRYTPLHVLTLLALIVGVWVSGWLCYRIADADSYWLDELHTVWTVQQPDSESLANAAASGNQSTFYFGIVKNLSAATGVDTQSPLGLRSFSILCHVLTVISLGFVVWYWTGKLYGSVLCVWVAGVDPRFLFYGSEARPYALLMLLAVWQFFVFLWMTVPKTEQPEAMGSSDRRSSVNLVAICLLLLSAALVLTHQTGLLLLAAELLILLGLRKRSQVNWVLLGAVILVACAAVVAWQSSTYSDVFQRRGQWNAVSSVKSLVSDYRVWLVMLCLVPLVIVYVLWEKKRFRSCPDRLTRLFTVGAAALLPSVFAGVSQYLGWAPLGLLRYTLSGAILLPLFAGLAVSCLRSEWLQAIIATGIVYAAIALPVPEPSWDGNSNVFVAANPFFVQVLDGMFDETVSSNFRMRYESWPNAVAEINAVNDQRPIFLFANLLEDAQIAESENGTASSELSNEFVDYLRFPLAAFSIPSEQVVPRPTLLGPAFQRTDVNRIVSAGGCWVLARCDAETFERIAGDLFAKLKQIENQGSGVQVKTKMFVISEQTNSSLPEWLNLFRIDLRPR